MSNYEYLNFSNEEWQGTTFGCSCCSSTESLSYSEAIEEMEKTSQMYSRMAESYKEKLELAKKYNIPLLYSVYYEYLSAKNELQAAHDYEDGKPCGTWQKGSFQKGYDLLNSNLASVEKTIEQFPYIYEVAEVFGWR